MKVIALANQKGGCGKTTTAVNLSYALSLRNKKTLLIDCDPQHHATTALGYNRSKTTLLNVFDNILKDNEFELKDYLQHRNVFLSVLPSEFELSALEPELSGNQKALTLLEETLSGIKPGEYDFVILDCPPNLGFLTLNALKISDIVIAPFDAGIFSLMGSDNLKKILNMLSELTDNMPCIYHLLTLFDKRSNFSKRFLNEAKDKFKEKLFSTVIRSNAHLRESAACGKAVFEHSPKSNGSIDYELFADELLKVMDREQIVEFKMFGHEDAHAVYVAGDFNNWKPSEEHRLVKGADDWKLSMSLEKGQTYKYKFIIDDLWVGDNRNPHYELDELGFRNSLIHV